MNREDRQVGEFHQFFYIFLVPLLLCILFIPFKLTWFSIFYMQPLYQELPDKYVFFCGRYSFWYIFNDWNIILHLYVVTSLFSRVDWPVAEMIRFFFLQYPTFPFPCEFGVQPRFSITSQQRRGKSISTFWLKRSWRIKTITKVKQIWKNMCKKITFGQPKLLKKL